MEKIPLDSSAKHFFRETCGQNSSTQGVLYPDVLCTRAWWDGILRFCDSEIVKFCTWRFAHVLRVKDEYFPRAARKICQTVSMTSY